MQNKKTERVKGKKNEYHVVHQKEFSLTDGMHEGVVSEELWEKAKEKRVATGIKLASKIGKDRTYLLTGILKCPKCGSPMYANRIRWTKKDGTEKEVMYYSCSRNKMKRGGFCDYSANLKKTDIEPLVIGVIKQIINDERFVEGVKSSIGIHVDADKIVEEIKNYEAKLKEVQLNKNRLETELDTLPIDAKYRDRKIKDMTSRIDSMYDVIAEIEEKIDDARYRKHAIDEKSLTFENIYQILVHFSKIYDKINDEDRKELLSELIKEIHIYPEGKSDYPLKSIKFAFPILLDGKEVDEIFLNKPSSVESVVCLKRQIQLLRSGTSIGANIHEANYAASKADFINKFQIALKECYETDYWLGLFKDTHMISEEECKDMFAKCSKVRKLLIASITTAKENV